MTTTPADSQETMNCEERLERIYQYIDDPLSCQDLEELQKHLQECPGCAQEYDLECIIRQAVRRTCKETAPSSLKDRIMGCIDQLHAQADHP